MKTDLEGRITQLIQDELVARGCELFKLTMYHLGRRRVVSFAIDRVEGGITLEECVQWNRRLSELLEQAGLLNDAYVVEVASPGADWPLAVERDYRRVLKRKLRVRYRAQDGSLRDAKGVLSRVEGGMLTLLSGAEEAPSDIELGSIVEARLEFFIPEN